MNDQPTENILPIQQDRYVYKELFKLADDKKKMFLFKNEAMSFFSCTGIPTTILEEIWQTVDIEQKDYITEQEFYQTLKLIACSQHGIEPLTDILSTQVPVPQFTGIQIKPRVSEITSITPHERDAYIGVFQSCNPIDGLLQADRAIEIFNKSNLPIENLRDIWELADTRKSGTLNKTEFIIAMHYITRLRNDPTLVLPVTLPPQVYSEASGRFTNSIRNNTIKSPLVSNSNRPRASSNTSLVYSSPVVSHMMTNSATSLSTGTVSIVVSAEEKEKYAVYFRQLDTDRSGFIDSEEAVYFFSHSQLPNSELGIIWEIADSRHLGKLDLDDFCVAMHLINMRKRGESIDRYVNALSIQQQQSYSQTPVIQNQQLYQPEDLNRKNELESELAELNKQLYIESQRLAEYKNLQQNEDVSLIALQNNIQDTKAELAEAKLNIEKAEELLKIEQKRNRQLLDQPSFQSSLSSSEILESSTPELAKSPSVFSGSSMMSPRSDIGSTPVVFDPFAGFKKMNNEASPNMNKSLSNEPQKVPLSPQQSKAITKYGFDISAFDTLSQQTTTQTSSVKDELASIFGSPSISNKYAQNNASNSEFDSIFFS